MGTGSSTPTNRTGKDVVRQKVENAQKTGVLSLQEHKLEEIPEKVFRLVNIRTLDVSKNKLKRLSPNLKLLTKLKSLNCDENKLQAGSLAPVTSLNKLQTLSAGGNQLGKPVVIQGQTKSPNVLPKLPPSLKQLKLDFNFLSNVPKQIFSSGLVKLEKLDLSKNMVAAVPGEIKNLVALEELNLDNNSIVALPEEIGQLKKLKALSLQYNSIRVTAADFSPETNPQPIPASLFADTPLIDLNLRGNKITSTQINGFDGFSDFLERRQQVKTKTIYGGALVNMDVCGLE